MCLQRCQLRSPAAALATYRVQDDNRKTAFRVVWAAYPAGVGACPQHLVVRCHSMSRSNPGDRTWARRSPVCPSRTPNSRRARIHLRRGSQSRCCGRSVGSLLAGRLLALGDALAPGEGPAWWEGGRHGAVRRLCCDDRGGQEQRGHVGARTHLVLVQRCRTLTASCACSRSTAGGSSL